MKEQRPFYVGWQDQMPLEQRSFLKKIIIPIFILIPLVAFILVKAERPFNTHVFQLGKISEFTGVYHDLPVPILEVNGDDRLEGFSNYMLLVGYGKFGAEGIIDEIEKRSKSLNGKKVTLSGTLIKGDGRAVLELTKKEDSLIDISEATDQQGSTVPTLAGIEVVGEILDPKCYFGVMKPGEGKIHKSCAIRCISGGIPPVFRVIDGGGGKTFYILLGEDGEKINRQILEHVGEEVSIKGRSTIQNGWGVIYADPQDINGA